MAKTKASAVSTEINDGGQDFLSGDDRPGAPPKGETGAAPVASGPVRYRVVLVCPTPLMHAMMVVEAKSEDEAKKKFMEANGISDSVHHWTITRAGEGE